MCGVAGTVDTSGRGDLRPLVEAIGASQACRGPDARGVTAFVDGECEIILGHTRLSVIDLHPGANQPMVDSTGDVTIVFNGEIYNYLEVRDELLRAGVEFRTESDTEVLLAAYRTWGLACLERLIGMFAFAVHDRRTGELHLVRDRFGVKPLFWWTDGTRLAFASTPGAIAKWAALPPDLTYVARGIRFKCYEDDGGTAPYAGLQAVPAGHALRIGYRAGTIAVTAHRYYDVEVRARALSGELAATPSADLEARLLTLLEDACRLRLRSDVTLGLSVSGGVDSSAIAGVLGRLGKGEVVGYSFADPADPTSEGPLVAMLAKSTGFTPHYVGVEGRDALAELFRATLSAQDAPFPHPSIMAQFAVFRAARAAGTTVLLGGQGGDEAFMGYRKFLLFYLQATLRGRRLSALPHLLGTILPVAPAILRRGAVFFRERRRYSGAAGGMGSSLTLPEPSGAGGLGMRTAQDLVARQAEDVTRYSLPTLLRYEDRNSMGNSIESRLPFMDHRFVEFGLALPAREKLGRGFGKWILRRAVRGLVPDAIRLNRDKRGFDVHHGAWIAEGLGKEIRAALATRRGLVGDLLPAVASLDETFSDRQLTSVPQRFAEAVSLIWVADRR